MKAAWTFTQSNEHVVLEAKCLRCGREQASNLLESFYHGGPCGVRAELVPEWVRERYAELNEAGKPRVPVLRR